MHKTNWRLLPFDWMLQSLRMRDNVVPGSACAVSISTRICMLFVVKALISFTHSSVVGKREVDTLLICLNNFLIRLIHVIMLL